MVTHPRTKAHNGALTSSKIHTTIYPLGHWYSSDQRRKKGWKPGRNFPESFQVWQKVLGQIIRVMLHIIITYIPYSKTSPFNDKYICHSFWFDVSEEIKFSLLDELKNLTAETFLNLKKILRIKFTFFFISYSELETFVRFSKIFLKKFVRHKENQSSFCDLPILIDTDIKRFYIQERFLQTTFHF